MPSQHRKRRGAEAAAWAAQWFRPRGFPWCEDVGAGRPGRDLHNMVGLAGEVKARADFDPPAFMRQAKKNAGHDLPFVLLRPNGGGQSNIAYWPVFVTLEDFTTLVRLAGYGDPIEREGDDQ